MAGRGGSSETIDEINKSRGGGETVGKSRGASRSKGAGVGAGCDKRGIGGELTETGCGGDSSVESSGVVGM